jgi:hypothetical protein
MYDDQCERLDRVQLTYSIRCFENVNPVYYTLEIHRLLRATIFVRIFDNVSTAYGQVKLLTWLLKAEGVNLCQI